MPRQSAETTNAAGDLLPFSNVSIQDFSTDRSEHGGTAPNTWTSRSRTARSASNASASILSSSFTQRTPARSFAYHVSHGTGDTPQYSSHGVRERTQELAAFALDSDGASESPIHKHAPGDSESFTRGRTGYPHGFADQEGSAGRRSFDSHIPGPIEEDSELILPGTSSPFPREDRGHGHYPESAVGQTDGTSTTDRRRSGKDYGATNRSPVPKVSVRDTEGHEHSEITPLLPKASLPHIGTLGHPRIRENRSDKSSVSDWRDKAARRLDDGRKHVIRISHALADPKSYTKEAAISHVIGGVQILSSVFLGLLLNVLDALSYGYILFPLGTPMFSHTGPDGISIFFVSCIVSQLCYSLGLSRFKGGVGSEMIEVVPFFHNMAYAIMDQMEGKSDESIMATVLVSYCLSSVVTGLIFLGLGLFKLGNLVSFFPRHILIGCIGGVGFFLFVTGIEVSARLEGNLNYDLPTLHKLFAADTVSLWVIPLLLAVIIIIIRRFFKSPFVLPAFFIAVFVIFYTIVKGILRLDLENVRRSGWIFEQPEAGVPFYRFYTYFKFGSIDGGALLRTIPTMFALSFFGIIHVPINVPALAAAVKIDDIDVNRELIAHGVSNTLSGLVGSIQNYLVYANSILFIENGGDSRLAGLVLAAATTGVWVAGPQMIGFIPVCLVGALIFLLGIELLEEAVWDTFGKLSKLEYLTIIAIVLIMGMYDFVVGIFAGIVLACLSYVVQSSRDPAIRASYSGEVAESTVRRPRADRRYLAQVRGQIRVVKLSGHLFFGTIVAVEEYMRSLMDDKHFEQQPISFMVVDFGRVTDLDFSAAEGFQRINRMLRRKSVKMILAGVSFSSNTGQALQNVGLLDPEPGETDCPPPHVFEDLNAALEACENDLLEAFYKHRSSVRRKSTPPMSINADTNHLNPSQPDSYTIRINTLDPSTHSPRRGAQMLAAATTMKETGDTDYSETEHAPVPSKWKSFAQPIKIILQTFEDVSDKDVDFWHLAAPYFERKEYPAGSVLYSRGDEPDGFYILEKGRWRAEYELDQGSYFEVILPGTTCGELPFFSETDRTGTVAAEKDSVAWLLTREKFRALERESPDVARELLKVGLKLTKERMDAVTSYVLVTAS